MNDLVDAGLAPPGSRVTEFASPHGGTWVGEVRERVVGVVNADGVPAELVVDSLGLMHEPDQRAAWAARVEALAPEGVLAVHVHPLSTILRDGTWNALRHGHFAYFSVSVLVDMARESGLVPVGFWRYPLYGGTRVLAFTRGTSRRAAAPTGMTGLDEELEAEARAGVRDPVVVRALQRQVVRSSSALRSWLDSHRRDVVVGYGAASRAVALLAVAGTTADDIQVVVDASRAKRGCAMPGPVGSRVPIAGPEVLERLRPDWVLLFVPDLLDEVRRSYPEVESSGGRWVVAEPEPVVVEPVSPLRAT